MADNFRKYKSLYSSTCNSFGTGDGVTITPNSVSGLPTGTEITLTFDRVNSSGTATPTLMERIVGTISGGNFVCRTSPSSGRGFDGSTEQAHTSPVVEMIVNAADWNDQVDGVLAEHNQDGTHKAVAATTLTSTIADTVVTNSSMSRQAIINGNFDVWQRGTSSAVADTVRLFLADRWSDLVNKDSGTLPTLTRSRQLQTSGDIWGSNYFTRLATNGAGSSLGVSSYGFYLQTIEGGTRSLCGLNKKVTVSFWARSSIANKRICPNLVQNYGTGGSPSAAEPILGTPITLTSSWVKYTATFTTNTLVGKTFGTALDDQLQLNFWYMWGTTYGNANVQASVTAETFGGSGTLDIAQVQLCAGDVALPFQPKSFNDELLACQRYYEKSYNYAVAPGTADTTSEYTYGYKTGTVYNILAPRFKVKKRIIPGTITVYDDAGTAARISTLDSGLTVTSNATPSGVDQGSDSGFRIYHSSTAFGIKAHWTADAEL